MQEIPKGLIGAGKHISKIVSFQLNQTIADINNNEKSILFMRAAALRDIFPVSKHESDFEEILSEICRKAPRTTRENFGLLKQAFGNSISDVISAIEGIARFIGLACLESYLISTEDAIYGSKLKLASLELGLDTNLPDSQLLSVIYTHKGLLPGLILDRFEESVSGGISKINEVSNDIDTTVSNWENRLKQSETSCQDIQNKIDKYIEALKKYSEEFAFLGLFKAFEGFFKRKKSENRAWGAMAVIIACAMFLIVVFGHQIADKIEDKIAVPIEQVITISSKLTDSKSVVSEKKEVSPKVESQTLNEEKFNWASISKLLPIMGIEILLLYFFRISLTHFNSTKAQMLQLEVRMSVCQFIQDYVSFVKENKDVDLSKFEAMVFSAIASDDEKMPSTFDGIEQLTALVKNLRG